MAECDIKQLCLRVKSWHMYRNMQLSLKRHEHGGMVWHVAGANYMQYKVNSQPKSKWCCAFGGHFKKQPFKKLSF